jgi:N-acyl-D-amino-acid deacylase
VFDLLISGGTVVDGTGGAPYRADVAVNGDRIAAIGSLGHAQSRRAIDATGKVVTPGFIDMHTHSDLTMRADARGWSKLRQGVTTDVTGNCGMTPYPVAKDSEREKILKESLFAIADDMTWGWHDLHGYREVLNAQGIGINVAPLVGHSAIRGAAIGFGEGRASSDDLDAMSRLLAEALDHGAFGLSTGLTLPPSSYGDTEEVVAIARTLATRPGRLYCSHVRGDTVDGPTGMREALEIGRRTGVPVHLAHMAVNDPRRWGSASEVMDEIDAASRDGVDVTCDVYPYAASSSGFSQCLPGWAQSGGRLDTVARLRDPATRARIREDMEVNGLLAGWPWHWDRLMVCRVLNPEWRHAEGMTFADLAAARGVAPIDAALDLMVADEGRVQIIFFYRTEEDMQTFLRHPRSVVGSDGSALTADGPTGGGRPHPRNYGAAARILGRYVRESPVLSLEDAVHRMSGKVANRLGLRDRGWIRAGLAADLAVIDAYRVLDRATFDAPHQYATGVPWVLVNGAVAVADGEPTGAHRGRVLAAN